MLHKERYAFFRKKPKVSFAPWREPFTKHILPLPLVCFSSPAIASFEPREA